MGESASLAAAATWAIASVLFAGAGRRLGPEALNFAKCSLGAVLLGLALALGAGGPWGRLTGEAWTWLALSALVGLSFGDSAFFGALNRLGPRRALVFWSLTPPMTAVLAAALLGEPVGLRMLLGMGVTVAGVTWVVLERAPEPSQAVGRRDLRIGVALGVAAALGQALGNIWTKQGGEGLGSLQVAVLRLGFGAAFLGVQVAATGKLRELARLSEPRLQFQVGVGTAVGTAAGIFLMVYGLQHTLAAIAATLTATSPIFVLPIAAFVLGERISLRAVLGAGMAVAGVALIT